MTISRLIRTAAVGAAALAVSGAAALAAQATVHLNVRAGPGTGYAVVDTLYPGENVRIDRCTPSGSWCYITHDGPDGWASARYLDRRSSPPPRADADIGIRFNTPYFSLRFGDDRHVHPRRHEHPRQDRRRRAEVCFYSDRNFSGRSFCAQRGEAEPRLRGRWNDRISSIEVRGNARVQVCEDWNYRGRCRTVNDSRRRLGPANDQISSYRVF